VKYRDFKYIIPFIVQFGLYVSPVGLSSEDVYASPHIPQIIKYLYPLNPMVGIIDGFRWCVMRGEVPLHTNEFILSITVSILFLIIGVIYFRRMEKTFADVI